MLLIALLYPILGPPLIILHQPVCPPPRRYHTSTCIFIYFCTPNIFLYKYNPNLGPFYMSSLPFIFLYFGWRSHCSLPQWAVGESWVYRENNGPKSPRDANPSWQPVGPMWDLVSGLPGRPFRAKIQVTLDGVLFVFLLWPLEVSWLSTPPYVLPQ